MGYEAFIPLGLKTAQFEYLALEEIALCGVIMKQYWSERIEALVAQLLPSKFWEKWYRFGMRVTNRQGDLFVTHHTRPLVAREVGTWSDPVDSPPAFAIVMQGPIAVANQFTHETLRIYSKHMPSVRLILSTWQDTDPKLVDRICALGVDVVLNARPVDPGHLNINMQIVSAAAGMQRAASTGAEWVLKTRTDQRLYAPNLPEFLVALARAFPVATAFQQRYRIIGLGRGTLKYGLYSFTDQTVFGHLDDMLKYWSPPLRSTEQLPEGSHIRLSEICRHLSPESYFASQFLSNIGREQLWTLADSWAAMANHFCIADPGTTDFFWPKYTKIMEYDRRYHAIDTLFELDFREWLILYSAASNKPLLDEYGWALTQNLRVPLTCPVRK